jgi:hypothetical protein
MAELLSINRGSVPTAPAANIVVVNSMDWDVVAAANGDTVYIGDLPAFHRILPEACSFIANGQTGAMNVDVCVGQASDVVHDNQAVVAATFARAAFSTFQKCYELGVSSVNRKVFLLLNTAPTVPGGKVTVSLAYYPDSV